MKLIIFYAALFALAILPLYFVVNAVYKDGIVGRAALLLVSFSASSILLDVFVGADKWKYDPSPPTVMLTGSFAVFLLWHLVRFHYRVLMKMKKDSSTDCPQDRRKQPDRRFA